MERTKEQGVGRARRAIAWAVRGPAGLGMGVVVVTLLGVGLVGWTMLTPSPVECEEPGRCRPQQTRLDDHGYLRALSLDLRGRVPTLEEYALLEEASDDAARQAVFDRLIDEWLASPEFARRVVRRHRALLWPNIRLVRLLYEPRRLLNRAQGIWRQGNRATQIAYRGGTGSITCRDEPATFRDDGTPAVDAEGREGYVMVEPYWAPGTRIKVCAFDAQERRVSPRGNDCSSREAIGDPGCGCGPNLRWCYTAAVRDAVLDAFAQELERRIVAHVKSGEPYYKLFTSRRAFVNGPLVYFWRYHSRTPGAVRLVPEALNVDELPRASIDGGPMSFEDRDEWVEFRLPEEHAGLLTHPVYLLRFQTNRARASRFFDAFLCQPFQPPEGGIPLDDPVAAAHPDVQKRPGCNYCHAILEPAAAYWGRWGQQGGGFLSPRSFPEFRRDCYDCGLGFEACSEECRTHYVTRVYSPEERANIGRLRAFAFLRDEHRPNVEEGPVGLLRKSLSDGRFTRCAVRRTFEWWVGRSPGDHEEDWMEDVSSAFLESDFSYRELVRAIVTSRTYRRVL